MKQKIIRLFKVKTRNSKQTQKLAGIFAKKIQNISLLKNCFVIGLQGNLGAGKTTFIQGFAKGLGIKEKIKSPSFAIMKIFDLPAIALAKVGAGHKKNKRFNHLIHIDTYRLKNPKEITDLGFNEIIKNPKNIVLIEWFEKIKNIVKAPCFTIEFKILKNNKRELQFSLLK